MQRTPQVRVEVTRWDWLFGEPRDRKPIDITDYVLSINWQKTIKDPSGSATIMMFPQRRNDHVIDSLETMDIVRIYEFGHHKFSGYIRRINYAGEISNDGQPNRQGSIMVSSFGGLFSESTIGLNLGNAIGDEDAILAASKAAYSNIANAVLDGASYSEIIQVSLDNWFTLLRDVGGAKFADYFDRNINYSVGVPDIGKPIVPREFQLYTGTEESIDVWSILQKLIEAPFNELWVDDGPRVVTINGTDVTLPDEQAYLVLRPTPFDGTVTNEANPEGGSAFRDLPLQTVDYNLFTSFNVAKSMDEVYSVFTAIPAAYNFGNFFNVFLGHTQIDEFNLDKFLYKPLTTQLFYTRMSSVEKTEKDPEFQAVKTRAQHAALTLRNWFRYNGRYLAGSAAQHVPKNPDKDPKTGEKVALPDIEGTFYIESVTHEWQYQGSLTTHLTITRGWDRNRNAPIELANRVFRRTIQ